MESTAQYWKPGWGTLEQYWKATGQKRGASLMSGTLHLAQAQSNRGPRGRKRNPGFSTLQTELLHYGAVPLFGVDK